MSLIITDIDPRLLELFNVLADLPPTNIVLWRYLHPHAEATLRFWCHGRMPLEESIGDKHHELVLWRADRRVVTVRLDDPRPPAREPRVQIDVEQMWRPEP